MSNQLKLGIFTAIGLVAVIISIIATGSFTLARTYNVYTKFDNISGLTRKAKVKIAGVDVGVLNGVSLDESKANLKLSISKKIILYQNASARIVSMGIIGTKYIEIIPGDASFPILKRGDYISSRQSPSLEDTLTNITTKINTALDNERDGNMMENLADAIYSLKGFLDNLEASNEEISSIIKNFNKFSTDLVNISSQNKQDLRDIIKSIKEISEKMNLLIARIYDGSGPIATLINDEQMSKDLKETVLSTKATVDSLNETIGKANKLQLSWNYTGRYSLKDEKYRSDIGISIMPSNHKFYYVGISNVADSHYVTDDEEKKNINTLDALLGFRSKKSEIYGGVIKSKAGIGFGYSFFEPIYTPYRKLKFYLNMYDFNRSKYGPQIDAGIRVGITKWLYTGVAVEDISYKTTVMPYLKIEIDDKDLTALLGIISIAAVASK
ncbi:MAG: MlaD family protein [Endomicrobium sp.]|jgi:phospholipid/cholesterol/gamma-HCH transport system substrate-binding protein|nr:MlaD family protein [Endomicrobium sp.]